MKRDDKPFQLRVTEFVIACFGRAIASDTVERNHRFIEESLELVQALGCTAAEAHMLVDYVFGRPIGNSHQECGGVMVTLAALASAAALDMDQAGEDELARVWTKIDQIREKQKNKPRGSPLPSHDDKAGIPMDTVRLDWLHWTLKLTIAEALKWGVTPQDAASFRAKLDEAIGFPALRSTRCSCYVLPHADDCAIFVGITQSGERVIDRRAGVDRRAAPSSTSITEHQLGRIEEHLIGPGTGAFLHITYCHVCGNNIDLGHMGNCAWAKVRAALSDGAAPRVGLPLLYNIVCLHRQPKNEEWFKDMAELCRLADKLLYEQGYEVSPYTTNEHQVKADSAPVSSTAPQGLEEHQRLWIESRSTSAARNYIAALELELRAARSAIPAPKDAALREGAAVLLQVAEMEEHNDAIFKGKWKKGAKAWSGEFIDRLRKEGMAKVREAMGDSPDGTATKPKPLPDYPLKPVAGCKWPGCDCPGRWDCKATAGGSQDG